MIVMTSMIIAEIIFSGILKLNAKYGNANAKFNSRTLSREARIPYRNPSVTRDTRNTASVIIAGTSVLASKYRSITRHKTKKPASIPMDFMIFQNKL